MYKSIKLLLITICKLVIAYFVAKITTNEASMFVYCLVGFEFVHILKLSFWADRNWNSQMGILTRMLYIVAAFILAYWIQMPNIASLLMIGYVFYSQHAIKKFSLSIDSATKELRLKRRKRIKRGKLLIKKRSLYLDYLPKERAFLSKYNRYTN